MLKGVKGRRDHEIKNIYNTFTKSRYRKFVRRIENWFLECKYNPKYAYCKRRLEKECKELYEN